MVMMMSLYDDDGEDGRKELAEKEPMMTDAGEWKAGPGQAAETR